MAINTFIKFMNPNIAGSSTAKGHEGAVEVLEWSLDSVQKASPLRGTPEKPKLSPLRFAKFIDSASEDLLKMLWSSGTIGKVELTCHRGAVDSGPQSLVRYLRIELEGVIVSKHEISGGIGDLPIEHVELSYAKITFAYEASEPNLNARAQIISYDRRSNDVV